MQLLETDLKLVPKRGLEPPHPDGYYTLNVARLPIPPLRHAKALRLPESSAWKRAYFPYPDECCHPERSLSRRTKAHKSDSRDPACNRFPEQIVQLALQFVETIRSRRRIRTRSAGIGALCGETFVRNALRVRVMAWRKPSEQSLARVVHYPRLTEMPKGGL